MSQKIKTDAVLQQMLDSGWFRVRRKARRIKKLKDRRAYQRDYMREYRQRLRQQTT